MGIMTNFVAVLTSMVTAFTSSYHDVNVTPPPDKLYNYAQRNTEQSSMIAQGSNMSAGIAVVDRAKGNAMSTNDTPAHKQFPLKTLAKLPIIMYAIDSNPKLSQDDNADAISMIQGFSADATNKMWEKYGGISIIQDLSKKYNLQETTASAQWFNTTMSAVDVARLIRRFMDDKNISSNNKRWVLSLLKTSPLSVSGEDMSWGIPNATGISEKDNSSDGSSENTSDNGNSTPSVWMQGWSPSGENPMVRHSVGMVGNGYRFITVIMSGMPESTSNDNANSAMNQTAQELISGGSENNDSSGITLGSEDNGESKTIQNFIKKNQKYMSK